MSPRMPHHSSFTITSIILDRIRPIQQVTKSPNFLQSHYIFKFFAIFVNTFTLCRPAKISSRLQYRFFSIAVASSNRWEKCGSFLIRTIFSNFSPSPSAHPRYEVKLRFLQIDKFDSSRPPSARRRCDKEAEFSSFTHCFLSFRYICLPFDDETMKGVSLLRLVGLFSMASVSKFRVWPHRWDLVR